MYIWNNGAFKGICDSQAERVKNVGNYTFLLRKMHQNTLLKINTPYNKKHIKLFIGSSRYKHLFLYNNTFCTQQVVSVLCPQSSYMEKESPVKSGTMSYDEMLLFLANLYTNAAQVHKHFFTIIIHISCKWINRLW